MIRTQKTSPLHICITQIEEKLGWGPSSQWASQDFDMLSEKIFDSTKEQVSATTLKRVWGRVTYKSAPSTHTLNTLAVFLGYENWREYVQENSETKAESDHSK